MLQKIPTNPGVYIDDTPLAAEGFWISADKIRFVRGLPQTMGGWELLTATPILGKCRAVTSWADNSSVKWVGFGTHTNAYILTDNVPYDVTPVVSRSNQVSISFTTFIGSAVVTADWTGHGLVQGQAFSLANATVPTVGGVTINTAVPTSTIPSPQYIVASVVTANQITFAAAQAATSNAGPTASTVDAAIYLAPGLADSIGALGYSTGTYSAGTYSAAASGDVFLRVWSLCPYGQNLLLCPRGGKIYEVSPATSATELVTNGTFSGSATGWTVGASWAYGANAVTATTSSAAVSQSITTPANAFCVITFDISAFAAGTLAVTFNSVALYAAIAANGRYTATFFTTGVTATLAFTGTGFTGTLDTVTVKQLLTAEVVPNAPTQNTCMAVTAEGFVMVGGTISFTTSLFDPMQIRWCDIGTVQKAEQSWTPGPTNLSGFARLLIGSRIVRILPGNNETLIWTDKALYAATYTANSNLVYQFRLVGTNCGLIGFSAATVLGGVAEWMAPSGMIYQYSGGIPTPVRSPMQKDVFDHIAPVQQDKIAAGTIGSFNDVIWLYPDSRDGTSECSRYTLHCTQELAPAPTDEVNQGIVGVFAPGTFDRLCWHDMGVMPYPIAVSSAGQIFFQEKGNTANGGTFSWSLGTGAFQTGNGVTQFLVDTFVPDFANFLGGCSLTVYSYLWPQSAPVAHGPFNITSASDQVGLMSDTPLGRENSLLFQGAASPAQMRMGRIMFDIQDTGMTF